MAEDHKEIQVEKSPNQVLKELFENYLLEDEEQLPFELKKGEVLAKKESKQTKGCENK